MDIELYGKGDVTTFFPCALLERASQILLYFWWYRDKETAEEQSVCAWAKEKKALKMKRRMQL